MSALALSCLIFVLTLGGILVGTLLRRALPEHHLSEDSQDVVRLGVGLIATISALVLGLLIAAAKSSYDTQSTQITQITADIILLDNLLAQYGPEANPIPQRMRSVVGPFADQIWREKQASLATGGTASVLAFRGGWAGSRPTAARSQCGWIPIHYLRGLSMVSIRDFNCSTKAGPFLGVDNRYLKTRGPLSLITTIS